MFSGLFGHVLCLLSCLSMHVFGLCFLGCLFIWILVCFLYGHVLFMDMCYVSGFEDGMNLLSFMDTFFIMIWQLSLLSPCGIYMVGCLLLIVLFLFQLSTIHFGGWRYF